MNLTPQVLLAVDEYAADTSGTALDLLASRNLESVLISTGAFTNTDEVLLYIEESFLPTTLFKVIATKIIKESVVELLKIKRTQRYLRVRLVIEFVQPDEMNPVASIVPLAVNLLKEESSIL